MKRIIKLPPNPKPIKTDKHTLIDPDDLTRRWDIAIKGNRIIKMEEKH
uniref:Uncharacterized protein n=1 Tax=viral metagenome TaxID=1070528 RepID=A0A6M3LI28_9ZZZZ